MRKSIPALGCVFATVWAFAVPAPRWVPADADIVVVSETSGKADPAVETAWQEAFKAEGGQIAEDPTATMEQLKELSPHLPDILKAFGMSEDMKTFSAFSAVYSFSLPKSAKGMDGSAFPKDVAFRLFIECSRIDVPALDKAVAALCAEKQKDEGVTIAFGRADAWRTLTFTSKEDGKNLLGGMFFGYRPVNGGLAFACCANQANAEAWAMGNLPAIAKESPLMAAFSPPEGAKGNWMRVCVGDLAGIATRLSEPKTREEMASKVPLLLKTHAVGMGLSQKGTNYAVALSATTDDEASAMQLRDLLLGWKGLVTQMFLPMITQKPSSALAALVSAIVCEAKGKAVSLRLEVTPAMGAKVVRECQEIAERNASRKSPFDALEDEGDEDGEPIDEEEARRILQDLDVK